MKVLVTGHLGFIGHHVTAALIERGHKIVGVDRINGAASFKDDRILAQKPWGVTHIAAQYSVKYTPENCVRYVQNNLAAFTYIFEAAKIVGVPRIVYASSIAISDTRQPSGLYGATKAYGEECAHAYAMRGNYLNQEKKFMREWWLET